MDDRQLRPAPQPLPRPEIGANADSSAVTWNALTGYAAWGVNLVVGLVVTPVLLHRLGAEGFGAWTLALTIAGYVGMVELGLGVATVRQLASSLALGDSERASIVASSARTTYLVMAGAGVVVLGVLVTAPGMVVNTGGVSADRTRVAVAILGIGYLLSLIASVYPAIAIGAGRADLGTTIGIVVRVATAAAQVAVVLVTDSLVALSLVTAVGVVGGMLAVRAVTRRFFPGVIVRFDLARRTVVRLLLSSGWRNAAIAIAAAVAIQSDVIVVGAILGPVAVATYGIAVRASTMAISLATRATDVLVPTFAHATEREDTRRTVTALRESVFLTRAILVPALVVFVAFGKPLLELWLGDAPANTNVVLVLLVLGAVVAAPGHSSFILLTGMNRLNFMLVGASMTAIANLGLSILLTWRVGIIGPVLGSLIAWVIWDLVVLPRHVGSLLRIPWFPLAAAGLHPLAVPAVCSAAVAWAAVKLLHWTSPTESLFGSVLVGLVYLGALWVTVGSERRARYQRLLAGTIVRRPRGA